MKVVVSYAYDSWGKLLGIEGELKDTLGVKNPYRYKGYRYDNETGLYYLKSRYYNPELGRFISADAVVGKTGEILSHNLFSYCGNNPVNAIDEDGNMFEWIKSKWNAAKKAVATGVRKVVSGAKRVASRVVGGVKKAVRSASNWVRNKFKGRTYTELKSSNRPRKWIDTGWRNIKKVHHTIVRYTNPGAIVNPKRYASQERMNEDIGTRILKNLQEDIVLVASVLIVAMTMSEINDNLDMYSLSGNGINVFSSGKGFRYATEIGGDAIKGGSKSKNLYKFTSKGTGKVSKNYKSTFFKAYPDLEGDVVVHHAIEQQVLKRYKGLFSEAEIHDLKNLRGIPKNINSKVHLSELRKEWNKFYKDFPKPTREEIINYMKSLDKKYGYLFNPPVK